MRRVSCPSLPQVSKPLLLLFFLSIAIAASPRPALATGDLHWSSIPTSDSKPVRPDTLRAWIEAAIARNQTSPPPPASNPGPFLQGYRSMVFAFGQCYSGGFDALAFMGPKIVVASATNETSHAKFIYGNSLAYYKWVKALIAEIKRGANRTAKEIFDAVKATNPDPPANTPSPITSTNGETVKIGNAANETNTSYHAVIFGGKQDAGGPGSEGEGQNIAAQNAINDLAATLVSEGKVPAANIVKKFPATYADIKAMIDTTWTKMNDNEQFLMFVVDHGARETLAKAPVVPDPETGGQQSYVPGPEEEHYYSSNVIDPAVMLEAPFILAPATVRLNDTDIDSLETTPDYSLQRIRFDPELLLPFPALNRIQILATAPLAPVGLVGFSTGPVHSGELMAGVPGAPSVVVALAALALLLGGLLVFARRRREAEAK